VRQLFFATISLAWLCAAPLAAYAEDGPVYRNIYADNPGGERYGEDDGEDGFTGYPVDPGEPGDAYYDTTVEHRRYSPNWTGAFVGGGLYFGLASANSDLIDGRPRTPTLGGFLQFSSLNHVIDLSLGFHKHRYTSEISEVDATIHRNSLALTVALHPGFLGIIGGDRYSYSLANFAILIGPSVEWTNIQTAPHSERYRSPGWHVGAVAGTYLDSPNDGQSFWLEFMYRYNNTSGDHNSTFIERRHIREHWLLLRLSFRVNGNIIGGMRGPDAP